MDGTCYKQRELLRQKAKEMRERMDVKGAEPLPDYVVTETLKNLCR